MPRFEVVASSTVIGYSDLESGDPPMGVACGRFKPLPSYSQIKDACVAARDSYHFSAELGPEEIEVHVVGFGYPLYQELFPDHVAAYEKQFRDAG